MTKEIEVSFTGLDYDDGYGDTQADLGVEVLLTYHTETEFNRTGYVLDSVKILGGTYWLIDQDGGEYAEREYDEGRDKDLDQNIIDDATEQFNSGKLAL